jgi:hypothetical protein
MKESLIREAAASATSAVDADDSLFVREENIRVVDIVRAHREAQCTNAPPDAEDDGDNLFSGQALNDEDTSLAVMLEQELNGKGLDTVPSEKQIAAKQRKPRAKAPRNAKEFIEKERQKEREKRKYCPCS